MRTGYERSSDFVGVSVVLTNAQLFNRRLFCTAVDPYLRRLTLHLNVAVMRL